MKNNNNNLAQEFQLALDQLRWQAAEKRWQIAAKSGRLNDLGWSSLEDAHPYWW